MARRLITTPTPARAATAYTGEGDVFGAIEDDTDSFSLARPVVIPGSPAGTSLPVTVTFPPGALRVVVMRAWATTPEQREGAPQPRLLVAGINTLRPSDFALPDEAPARVTVRYAAFGADGAWSGWFPMRLIWANPKANVTTRLSPLDARALGAGLRALADVTARIPSLGVSATGVVPVPQSTILGWSDDAPLLGWADDAPLELEDA